MINESGALRVRGTRPRLNRSSRRASGKRPITVSQTRENLHNISVQLKSNLERKDGKEKQGTYIFDTMARLAPALAYSTPVITVNTKTDMYGAPLSGRAARNICGTMRSCASCSKSSQALRMPVDYFRYKFRF